MRRRTAMPMVDAPVSGGTGGAEAGTLTFMVGGGAEGVRGAPSPCSRRWARTSSTAARPATGQVAKICNNMMLAIEMIAHRRGHDARRQARHGSRRCFAGDRQHLERPLLELGHLQPVPRRARQRARLARLHRRLRRRPHAEGPDARRPMRRSTRSQPVVLGAIAQQLYQMFSAQGPRRARISPAIINQYMKR